MERLIQVVNKLQDAFAQLGSQCPIDLPQIAVVGGQSAGKSSVLENFVGRDFLPRGAGIVTRRPLVLQLITSNGPEYGEFLHQPNKKYTDFAEVCREIEAETDRVTGSNKNISPLPINLRVYSPHVLNLTLVDLPGLTKVPVGDQPADIDRQIKGMVTEFISNPNCLILAVTPANIDLANSDALLLAREVDPQGLRTIGVITKIDLMDQGTDCRDVLLNITYPLKRGYVGVVNRSQADINHRKDIKAAQQAEYNFFAGHRAYRDIVDRTGTAHLQNVLNRQLSEHIKRTLPALKKSLMDQLLKLEKDVAGYRADSDTPAGRARTLMVMLQEFSQAVNQALGLRHEMVEVSQLSYGAKINKLLSERFIYEMNKLKPNAEAMRTEIRISIQNSQGVRNTIFTPDAAFTTICRKAIGEYREIGLMIIDKIFEQLTLLIDSAASEKLAKFFRLQDEIKSTTSRRLFDFVDEAKKQVGLLMDLEMSYINTRHPDFLRATSVDVNGNPSTEVTNDENEEETQLVISTDGNTVIRKGYLSVPTNGLLKSVREYWFVLKGDRIYCYKDEMEKELKYAIDIQGCRSRPIKKAAFAIYHPKNKLLIKDMKQLELYADSEEAAEDWKASLMTRGVFTDTQSAADSKHHGKEDKNSNAGQDQQQPQYSQHDQVLFRQIELIRKFVNTYTKIVTKTLVDIVTKICMHMVITRLDDFIQSELVAYLYSSTSVDDLMQESDDEMRRKKELFRIYEACKGAIEIINGVMNQVNSAGAGGSSMNADGYDANFSLARQNQAFEGDMPRANSSAAIAGSNNNKQVPARPGAERTISSNSTTPNQNASYFVSNAPPVSSGGRALPPRPGAARK